MRSSISSYITVVKCGPNKLTILPFLTAYRGRGVSIHKHPTRLRQRNHGGKAGSTYHEVQAESL